MKRIIYLSLILLLFLLIIYFVQSSPFPIYYSDYSSFLSQASFLEKYSQGDKINDWYNDYTVLGIYSPAWFYCIYFLSVFLGNLYISSVILSIVFLIFVLFGFIYLFDKLGFSRSDAIIIYLLSLFNPLSFEHLFLRGRFPSLFAFSLLFCLIIISYLLYYDKIKQKHYLILSYLFLTLVIAFYLQTYLIYLLIIISFAYIYFLKYKYPFILRLIIINILSLITNFWIINYISNYLNNDIASSYSKLSFDAYLNPKILIFTILINIFIFALVFYNYKYKSNTSLLLNLNIISLLVFTLGIVSLIPLYNSIWLSAYYVFVLFILILVSFIMFKDNDLFSKIMLCISILFLLFNFYSLYHYDIINNKDRVQRYDQIFSIVNDSYIIYADNEPVLEAYGYGTYKYHLKTPDGWFPQGATKEQLDYLDTTYKYIKEKDCRLIDKMNEQSVKYLVTDLNINCSNLELKKVVDRFNIYYLN